MSGIAGRWRGPERASRRKALLFWSIGLAALALTIFAVTASPRFFSHLSDLAFDRYQQAKPRIQAGAPVMVVDIDETSLRTVGQWPWPRSQIATLVDRLGQYGAAAIAFDIVFPEPDRTSPLRAVAALEKAGAKVELPAKGEALDNDRVLARAFAANPVIAGIAISNETSATLPAAKAGFAFGGSDPKSYLPAFSGGVDNLPMLSEAARGLGFFSFPTGGDGVVRALPLIAAAQRRLYPALAVEALRVAQGADAIVVRSTGASGEADTGHAAMVALKVGGFSAPTGPRGDFRVYYSGLPAMVTLPAARLLQPDPDPGLAEMVAGHIVLIGTSAVGLRDLVATPFQQAMPGVRVHAEIIDQIMGQTFLARPDWARGAEILAALLLGLAILAVERRAGAAASSLAAVGMIGLWSAVSWFAFSYGRLLIDPVLPGAAVAIVFAATMPVLLLLTDREKRFIHRAFAHYLSPGLVERLADNPQALALGGETRELTVLFSDIRGFTSLSENLDPQALTRLLNDVLTPATDVLLQAEATIDKYIGDAIMAFWNAPLDIEDHRRKACLAALSLQGAVAQLGKSADLDLRVGIGLNSGACCVGNLGSAQRFSYSAIGDGVNLASRVEGLTKQYGLGILVTEATRSGAPDLAFIEADRVRVVGRSEPVVIHALLGDAAHAETAGFAAFAKSHEHFLHLYRRADLDAAKAALEVARQATPNDLRAFYAVYDERLAAMRLRPPPGNWDGIFVAREK
ncbi:MAG: adenylate/guanylate cyclase domain-containing protein [Mesorhizobium sp.]